MERQRPDFKKMLYEKLEEFDMTKEEYTIFLLQGIKKELILIRTGKTGNQYEDESH